MTQLPATDDFQVLEWPDPEEAKLSWLWDQMHYPEPLVPLLRQPNAAIDRRILNNTTRYVNGYPYSLGMEIPPPTPELLEKGLKPVWEGEYIPRIRAWCESVRNADYESMSAAGLADRLEALTDEAGDTFKLTMVVIYLFMGPTLGLTEFLAAELGEDGPVLAGTILQGEANQTASAGSGLGKLAEVASRSPELADALRSGRFENLEALPGGEEFMAAFRGYLEEYGSRLESWAFFEKPTWSEDRSVPLGLIGRYLQDSSTSPAAAIARSAEQRAAALREVESRLEPAKLGAFRAMLEAASAHVTMSENRAHWQLSILGSLRWPILALGRKLAAAGVIEAPEDIFYLEWEEALEAGRTPRGSLKERVAQAKAEMERYRKLAPPPFVGAPPDLSQAPPEMQPVFKHFFGLGSMPSMQEKLVTGNPASRGVARGRARIIRSLADSDRLEPGDVLVCSTTSAPWTPLFAIAGAVVTDTGGVLSHSGICAREYGIPAVVGTHTGTRVIPEGAMVTVDGTAGTVVVEG
jgi:phosphohistidine swiveling domain-containing protein